jgi:hypothetical protein
MNSWAVRNMPGTARVPQRLLRLARAEVAVLADRGGHDCSSVDVYDVGGS